MTTVKAYAAQDATSAVAPWQFDRRDPRPFDVEFDILYCGVCHSDLHQIRNEWGTPFSPWCPAMRSWAA